MLWTVDPTDPTPLFTQLVNSVRRAIATGELSVGDRLPAARELARSLAINMHTVLRAYQDLREAGTPECVTSCLLEFVEVFSQRLGTAS